MLQKRICRQRRRRPPAVSPQVELTSSAAQEESCFLADHLQSLLDERAALREGLERAQRPMEL